MAFWQILYGIAFVLILTLAVGAFSAAPWVPTRRQEIEVMVKAVPLLPGAKVYDLGCGDGSLLFALVDAYPGIRALGYDIALPPLIIGWIRRSLGGPVRRGVSLRWGDLFGRSVSDADAVFMYLMPRAQERIRAKLARELRDDAFAICEAWPLPGVRYERKLGAADGVMPIYVYKGSELRRIDDSTVKL